MEPGLRITWPISITSVANKADHGFVPIFEDGYENPIETTWSGPRETDPGFIRGSLRLENLSVLAALAVQKPGIIFLL